MKKLQLSNYIVPILVVLIVLLIVIPLPDFLLDAMFILNLGISFIILLITMNITETLQFSIFPTLLLITTVFRLGLNISSTNLILTQNGNAGAVIETFGNFVIRGNVVVGIIIFLIIVIVQFVVITKGSERVAEVSARFTLDAMPGKQMAIDADLNSGLIDEQTAKKRRSDVQREADFYGAMDGASKFVKGDAIVSIIVVFINLIGGIIIGFINNVGSFGEIANIFSVATIGQGLVNQIPALLISVAMGMVVTRSASEDNLGSELRRQFFSQPRILIIGGSIILVLAFMPGMPKIQILMISLMLIGLGIVIMQQEKKPLELPSPEISEEITTEASFYKNIDNVYNLLSVETIGMEFGYSLIPLVDEGSGGNFLERIVMFRKTYAQEMGIVIPSVQLKDSARLNPNQYSIKFKGEEVAQGDVLVDHFLAISSVEINDNIDGIETVEPAFGLPAKWISEDKRIQAEIAGYTLIDPTSVIVTHLSEVIKNHVHELLTRSEVNNILTNLKKTNESLVNDLVPSVITVTTLQKVLANLLREHVSIRDMETILETLADFAPSIRDLDVLTEYVRQALKRTITRKFSEGNSLKVVTLDANVENMIMNSVKKVDNGSYLALEPSVIQNIVQATTREVDKIKDLVPYSVVLTSPIVRTYFKKLVDQFYPNIVVLSFNELDNNVQIQSLGNIVI